MTARPWPTARRVLAATVAVTLVGSAALVACSGGSDDHDASRRPNILFILTDDATVADLAAMPDTTRWFTDGGTSFDRFYDSVSLCCPARVTMERGQYAHNTGVLSNEGGNGGFPVAHALGVESSTVATWLDDAGYRTALVGKYLNFYPQGAGVTYVPPGWDEWFSPVGGDADSGYDYSLNENGHLVPYAHDDDDFASQVFVDHAIDVADRAAEAGQPFFTWLAVPAPHEPAGARDEDVAEYAAAEPEHPPSYDQADVTDMPEWVRELPHLSAEAEREILDRYRHRQASLRSLDRELQRLFDSLDDNGQLDDTYVVLTSDNGFHLGQHRLKAGKQSAFEEDVNVPLLVRGPDVPSGARSDALLIDTDLAPTFAAIGGARVPAFVDGRSLLDLWRDPGSDFSRRSVLLEHWPATSGPETPPSSGAGGSGSGSSPPPVVTDSPQDPGARGEGPAPPQFSGVRTERYTYVEYVTGEVELYDNEDDPDQIHNIAEDADPALLRRLSDLVGGLATCKERECRELEDQDVP